MTFATHSLRAALIAGVSLLAMLPALAAEGDAGTAHQRQQGAAELADEPRHL